MKRIGGFPARESLVDKKSDLPRKNTGSRTVSLTGQCPSNSTVVCLVHPALLTMFFHSHFIVTFILTSGYIIFLENTWYRETLTKSL